MNLKRLFILGPSLVGVSLFGAQPVVQWVTAQSILVGESQTFSAGGGDSDSNLSSIKFLLSGPGITGFTQLGAYSVSGSSAGATQAWTASAPGLYTLKIEVLDATGYSSSSQLTFDVFAERRTLNAFTLNSGQTAYLSARGELKTAENTSAITTSANNGSSLIMWSTGRIVLKPGFKVSQGAFYWGAIDHDEDSYSDLEEATDSDGDGMFDAWEVDHGLNPFSASDKLTDLDGDGASNYDEFLANRSPDNNADGPSLPAGFDLVIVTGTAKYGINTSTWTIQGI